MFAGTGMSIGSSGYDTLFTKGFSRLLPILEHDLALPERGLPVSMPDSRVDLAFSYFKMEPYPTYQKEAIPPEEGYSAGPQEVFCSP